MDNKNMGQIFDDLKNNKNNVCESIYNDITTIIDTNSVSDCINKMEEYINDELKNFNFEIKIDEITANIDNDLEFEILEELKNIQVIKNKSIIHITHNMENLQFSDYKMYIKNCDICFN